MDSSKFLIASDNKIKIFVYKCGHLDTNIGFIENVKQKEAVLIDAAFGSFEVSKKIFSHDTKVVAVMFTHGHWDHIGDGNVFQKSGAKIYANKSDKLLIENPGLMSKFLDIDEELLPCRVDKEIDDGDVIKINDWLEVDCRSVPGHAAGDAVFYLEEFGCVFVGDTLFRCGIGRSDFPGGDGKLLIKGIKEKILSLKDDTIVIPGHGKFTTISTEKRFNLYLK